MAALGDIRYVDDEVRERRGERDLYAVDPHIDRSRADADMRVQCARQRVRDAIMLGVKVDARRRIDYIRFDVIEQRLETRLQLLQLPVAFMESEPLDADHA